MTAPVMDRRPTRTSLLPSGSSALEKLIDEQCPQWDSLLSQVQADSAHTGNHPSHKPWLAAEWGLSPFADQFADIDALLEAGVPWLRERGSAAAVRRVLGWLGYTTNVVLEEEGPYLHIDLGRVASAEELEVVARLVRHSIPLHVHFYRVYHGWDLRALRLDGGQPLDQAMLDTDSGAWVNTSTGALKVSFVSWHRRLLPKQPEGAVDWTHAAWRSDRLPHRAAGTLRWATGGGWGLSTWAPGMDGNGLQLHGNQTPMATLTATPSEAQALYSTTLLRELPALAQSTCNAHSQGLPERAPQPGWDDDKSWLGHWLTGADSARSETQDSTLALADTQALRDTQAQGEAQSTIALPLGTSTTASPATQQSQGDTTTALRTGDALEPNSTLALQSGDGTAAAVPPLPTSQAQSTSALPLGTSTTASTATQQSQGDTTTALRTGDALEPNSTQALQSGDGTAAAVPPLPTGMAQSTSALPLGTSTTASPVTQQSLGDTSTALRTGDALEPNSTLTLQSGTANTAAVAPLPTSQAQSTSALPLSTSTTASPATQQSLGDTSALTPRADALQAATTQALQSSATPAAPMAVTTSSAWAQWGSVCASWVRTLGSSDHAHTRQTLWPERFTPLGWSSKTWSNTERWGLPLDRRASTLTA
ncbi:phage tail protein [Limnohabitans sp. WS1]|uniref:phage tail protein n=1 Tax=Limnohabitans sp. WS1 TaxID=1100726 RepID=UPI000D3413EF|nr:phage tail protein [Limnohabitans sp. WS1]PUE20352.1 hypothetical protein B9Z48_05415 [Limnohabitans sp. WS1]